MDLFTVVQGNGSLNFHKKNPYWSPYGNRRFHSYYDNDRRANSVEPGIFLHHGDEEVRVYRKELEDQLLELNDPNPTQSISGSKNNLL